MGKASTLVAVWLRASYFLICKTVKLDWIRSCTGQLCVTQWLPLLFSCFRTRSQPSTEVFSNHKRVNKKQSCSFLEEQAQRSKGSEKTHF